MLLSSPCTKTVCIPEDSWRDGIDPVSTGLNLKCLRRIHGLTQEGLSEAMGKLGVDVTVITISNWENGHWLPSTEALKALSVLYNCKIDDLLITYREDVFDA